MLSIYVHLVELYEKRTFKFTFTKRGGIPSYDDQLGSS